MSHKSPKVIIGLGAAAVAFGVAAMMSAATAPAARADDFSDIITQVEYDLTTGQADFSAAESAFASNPETGLGDLLSGIDDDFLSAPQDLVIGTAEAANGLPLSLIGTWGFAPVPSFSDGLTYAEGEISDAQNYFADAVQELTAGDYGYAVYFDAYSADFGTIDPLDEILLGAVSSL
jgi:hypothetical protein